MAFPLISATDKKLILGVWRWNGNGSSIIDLINLLDSALECGITILDHADIYGNYECEKLYGKILAENPEYRDQFQVATKCGIKLATDKFPNRNLPTYDTSRDHIIKSAESSLQKMNIDKIDLLMIHRPDPLMDPDEVAEAFTSLRDSGKVIHFGVSNFNRDQFLLLQSRLDFALVTNQIELSLTHSEPFIDGTVDFLHERNASIMAWSPLGGGSIFSNEELMAQLDNISKKYDCSPASLIIAWLMRHPSEIIPVLGTTNSSRLKEISRASEVIIDREDWFQMLKYARGYDIP